MSFVSKEPIALLHFDLWWKNKKIKLSYYWELITFKAHGAINWSGAREWATQFCSVVSAQFQKTDLECETECYCMCFVVLKSQLQISACKTVFYGQFCITLAGFSFSGSGFLAVLRSMSSFAKTLKLAHSLCFIELKLEDIGANFRVSGCLLKANLTACNCHICVTKNMFWSTAALNYVQNEASYVFRDFHLHNRILQISSMLNRVSFCHSAKQYLARSYRPKVDY